MRLLAVTLTVLFLALPRTSHAEESTMGIGSIWDALMDAFGVIGEEIGENVTPENKNTFYEQINYIKNALKDDDPGSKVQLDGTAQKNWEELYKTDDAEREELERRNRALRQEMVDIQERAEQHETYKEDQIPQKQQTTTQKQQPRLNLDRRARSNSNRQQDIVIHGTID